MWIATVTKFRPSVMPRFTEGRETSSMKNIGIVIPAYNAARTVAGVLERIPGEIWDNCAGVWIVDDGSFR